MTTHMQPTHFVSDPRITEEIDLGKTLASTINMALNEKGELVVKLSFTFSIKEFDLVRMSSMMARKNICIKVYSQQLKLPTQFTDARPTPPVKRNGKQQAEKTPLSPPSMGTISTSTKTQETGAKK